MVRVSAKPVKARRIEQTTTLTSALQRLEITSYEMLKRAMKEGNIDEAKKILEKSHKLKIPRIRQIISIVEKDKKFQHVFTDKVFSEKVKDKLLRGLTHSIAFIDIDFFKEVNDLYKHKMGDRVLRIFSESAARIAKKYNGIVSRYGGDEFAMYLPIEPYKVAEILKGEFFSLVREKLRKNRIPENITGRFSAGIATERRHAPRIKKSKHWVKRAKSQVYSRLMEIADYNEILAKQRGRGKIVIDKKLPSIVLPETA